MYILNETNSADICKQIGKVTKDKKKIDNGKHTPKVS